jgi:hypothetical protein
MTESRTPLPTAYNDRTRLSSAPTVRIIPSFQRPQNKPKLLDLLREALRFRHYSRRTEATYCSWVKRFIYFHNVRHPYGPGIAGAQRCTNDHDLYACSEPGRSRSAQPGGQLIGRE